MKRLVLCLFLVACGKSESTPSNDKPAPKQPAVNESIVAEVNAAIPASLKGKLEFIAASFADRDHRLEVPEPKGWVMSDVIPGSFKAPDGLGFMTKFTVGSSCNGSCEKKDWAAASNEELFAQFKDFDVEQDAKADGMRTLVASKDGMKYIVVAKWKADASRYFSCTATLDKEVAEAAPAFEKACRALAPEW